jgi:nitrite reductase/ring-hydroxylating ferredoxin subunit
VKTIPVATASQVKEGELFPVTVESQKVMLTRVAGKVHAVANKCPHLGMRLSKSKVCDGAVTCRWHGATFDLTTGKNIKWVDSFVGIPLPESFHGALSLGKSPQGLKVYAVKEDGEQVSIEIDS